MNASSSGELPRRGAYVPALDGVRGLAIIMVMLAHFTSYGGLRPVVFLDRAYRSVVMLGGTGVDLFFVLSGFLITGILLDSRHEAGYFRNFYMRRVLRIFPLYYATLAGCFLILPLFRGGDEELARLLSEQGWYWTYLANVRMALDGWPAFNSIGHFWSLAVEEQFYMVWPLAVFAVGGKRLRILCVMVILGSLLARVAFWQAGYLPRINVMTVARMDALAAGAFLAVAARRPGGLQAWARRARPVALVTGTILVLLLVWSGGWVPQLPVYRTVGRSLLAGLFAAVLILAVAAPSDSRLGRFFGSPILRFFGVYSYGLYVFHHFVIIFLGRAGLSVDLVPAIFGSRLPGQIMVITVAGSISAALAWVSYHSFEKPFLTLKRAFRTRPAAAEIEAREGKAPARRSR